MSWYLTRNEIASLDRAIPVAPKDQTRWDESGQVRPNRTLQVEVSGMRPGPGRDARFKILERLRNYERVRIKRWWATAGAIK